MSNKFDKDNIFVKTNRYDDIIDLPAPNPKHHKRMERAMRAAQFAPFQALTGFEEAVIETARTVDKKIVLSEDAIDILSLKLNYLKSKERHLIEIFVTYFIKDEYKDGGIYVKDKFTLKKVDEYERKLLFTDGSNIAIDDIVEIEWN
ncbi:MAG: hypothetical protein PT956_00785 [Firmicutes bacterium]|nr:hypothetical protein [Ezakiella sp.]MDD7761180.1 hypothetical protein [Bacillota bacterium]